MSRQINLFNPELAVRHNRLTLLGVLQATGVVLVLLLGVAAYASYRADLRQEELRLLDAEVKSQRLRADALLAQLQGRKPDAALVAALTRARASLDTRQQLVQLFNAGGLAASSGFAEDFRALARQSLDGVWLTGFQIGADDLLIRGRLFDQSLLPVYVRRIEAEPVFKGRSFAALEMQEIAEVKAETASRGTNGAAGVTARGAPVGSAAVRAQPRSIEFVLRSQAAPPAGDDSGAPR